MHPTARNTPSSANGCTKGGRLTDPLAGTRRPDPAAGGATGLWLVRRLCDRTAMSGPARTGPPGKHQAPCPAFDMADAGFRRPRPRPGDRQHGGARHEARAGARPVSCEECGVLSVPGGGPPEPCPEAAPLPGRGATPDAVLLAAAQGPGKTGGPDRAAGADTLGRGRLGKRGPEVPDGEEQLGVHTGRLAGCPLSPAADWLVRIPHDRGTGRGNGHDGLRQNQLIKAATTRRLGFMPRTAPAALLSTRGTGTRR
jgi:hypothetical protein